MEEKPEKKKIRTDIFELDDEFGQDEEPADMPIQSEESYADENDMRDEFREAVEEYKRRMDVLHGSMMDKTEECESDYEPSKSLDLTGAVTRLESYMKTLETMFRTKIMADGKKDSIIDSMHAELQQYKDDMYAKVFKPLLSDLIYLKEDMRKLMRGIKEKDDEQNNGRIISVLDGYCLDIDDILEKYDVKIFDCEEREYVPIRQKIIKIMPTAERELDGIVAEKLSDGYELGGKVIFQQKTIVYKFNENDGGDNNG